MADNGRDGRTRNGLRSIIPSLLGRGDRRRRHDPAGALAASIARDPPFPLGMSTILADFDLESIDLLLAAIVEAIAMVDADDDVWSDPGDLDMNGFDWVEMEFPLSSGRRLRIGMPTVLDGRWIAHDRVLMLRVAAACLVDLDRQGEDAGIDTIVEWMTRAQSLAQRMAARLPEDAGAHFAMPSHFGPADLRSHAITGAPIAAYDLPDDAFVHGAPSAYEMYGGDRGESLVLEIKRARSLSSPCSRDDSDREWIDRTIEAFVPTARSEPIATTYRTLLAIDKGGRLILVRDPSTGLLTLPSYDREGWEHRPDPKGIHAVSTLVGGVIDSPRTVATIQRVSRMEGRGPLVLDVVRGSCRTRLNPAHDDDFVLAGPFSAIEGMDPMIQALVMPDVRTAFGRDEAEATGPDPYADRRVVIDPAILATGRTNAEVVAILLRILKIRGRFDRVIWNAFRQSGVGTSPRAAAGALGFVAIAGGAFEDLPDVLAQALKGRPEDQHGSIFEGRLADAYRMYSGIRIPRSWHPEAFSAGGHDNSSEHIRDIWRELCDAIAEPLGLKPRYGVLVEQDAFG